MTSKLTSKEHLAKILSETQATIMEHNSRCVRGSVEVDARLFESMIMELQERRKADSEPDYDIHRDANRYRFLRDKDAFGDEGSPGLAGWDDLAELDMGEFDSAVDARINDSGIALYSIERLPTEGADADIYAELYRLRSEIKGPDGFDTWRDAAIAEKKARVELEKQINQSGRDIDYLGAMAAFHSDKWHKMDPITGYMHGWNARRNHAQQQVVPATLPCSVELKPGLIIGMGCKTETLLTALRSRADYNADIDAMTPEQRAEHDANIEAFKAMLPQPAPVVPEEMTAGIAVKHWQGGRGSIESFVAGYNFCRAAMLTAAPQPQNEQQNIPEIIPGWIPVSERMPEGSEEVLCAKEFDGPGDWRRKVGYLLAGKWTVYGASWAPTHWMPLPAAPEEVKGE